MYSNFLHSIKTDWSTPAPQSQFRVRGYSIDLVAGEWSESYTSSNP